MHQIDYCCEPQLSVDEFIEILIRSTLAERRPIAERDTMATMLSQADIILTARHERRLVGISRAITDFSFCTYLSDLAVDVEYQRHGIGKELIQRTHDIAGHHTMLVLLAAPLARSYYPHIGMKAHDSCWIIERKLRGVTGSPEK